MSHFDDAHEDVEQAPAQTKAASPASTETEPSDETSAIAEAIEPVVETVTPVSVPAEPAFEAAGHETFHVGSIEPASDAPSGSEALGAEPFDAVAHSFRASMEEVVSGMGQLNAKLMEFTRATAQNNVAFMQNAATARSVSDAMAIQTAYLRDQYGVTAEQLRELQTLTAEIAQKAAAPFQKQFIRSTQMFRNG